jgi:hypothetical protein
VRYAYAGAGAGAMFDLGVYFAESALTATVAWLLPVPLAQAFTRECQTLPGVWQRVFIALQLVEHEGHIARRPW